ncbi:DUF3466 family protein [Vibrio hepatarius]|uniref:DUF3466 family protein n=1 Tax=Vibrio hepatarius TaxID=171383 RepID=UPI001C08671F|nr:DUF3466 family protein [Vibrio hepatarius]MBU2898876.1 DUF3466 family protein [Vibrio hepatarius]
MSKTIFKLSSVTLSLFGSFAANAAIYTIIEIDESQNNTYGLGGYTTEYYGTAVQEGTSTNATLGCFGSGCSSSGFPISAETRNWKEGISYREEVPFAMDNSFIYPDSQSEFESYCLNELGYKTCQSWAEDRWAGYQKELDGTYTNSIAFVEGSTSVSGENAVINSFSGTESVGNKRDGGKRNVAFIGTTDLNIPSGAIETKAWKSDGTFTVGSVSREQATESNGTRSSSKASIWGNSPQILEIGYGSGGVTQDKNVLGQASIRDFVIDGTTFFGVGYNTYSNQRMDASVFVGDMSADLTDVTKWTFNTNPISGATSGTDYIYSNSVVKAVNDNFVAVGSAKRSGKSPENRVSQNRLFYISDIRSSPAANYFSGGIFFSNAGGTIGSINNFNEVVGSVDIQKHDERDGKEREKRGFIYPLSATGTDTFRRTIFANQAWILDDLTNNGLVSSNNNTYRILEATDVNDAGVISATAKKCAGSYDTTEMDSYCQGGTIGVETIVAVKLIPIEDATNADIQPRSFRSTTVERKGGSLTWFALLLIGLLGFRRK